MVFHKISTDWAKRGVYRRVGDQPVGQRFSEKLCIRRLVFTKNFCRLALLLAATRSYVVPDKNVRPFLDRKSSILEIKLRMDTS
jgi:hypothetical protein